MWSLGKPEAATFLFCVFLFKNNRLNEDGGDFLKLLFLNYGSSVSALKGGIIAPFV